MYWMVAEVVPARQCVMLLAAWAREAQMIELRRSGKEGTAVRLYQAVTCERSRPDVWYG